MKGLMAAAIIAGCSFGAVASTASAGGIFGDDCKWGNLATDGAITGVIFATPVGEKNKIINAIVALCPAYNEES